MQVRALLLVLTMASLSGGCASSLKTFDAEGKAVVGVPVRSPALVKITSETKYEAAPGSESFKAYCTTEISSEYKFLPLGELNFITFDPAPLGKGEFRLEFNDAGGLKVVSLNSDATAGVEQISGLLTAALPYLAAPKVSSETKAGPGEEPAQKIKNQHCLKKSTEVVAVDPVKYP